MSYYVVIVYDDYKRLHRLLRFLQRHGRVEAVAILAAVEDARVLGAVKSIVDGESVTFRGYLPLPRP